MISPFGDAANRAASSVAVPRATSSNRFVSSRQTAISRCGSATAAAREAFGPSAEAHRLVRLANEGDAKATELLEEVAGYLGSGIGSFVNVFAPQLVVLGGGFGVAAYDYLRGPAEEVARREALEPMRSTVRLARAELGTAAGLIGAAFVGFEALDAA